MSEQISWRVELKVKAGQLDNFQALTGEMVLFTQSESGVMSYERFVSEDGTIIHVHERYADSISAFAHLRNFKEKFSTRFTSAVERIRFMVFGRPSAELRKVLDELGAIYMRPFGAFPYWT
jgi:quinol monooxygenase YgiN